MHDSKHHRFWWTVRQQNSRVPWPGRCTLESGGQPAPVIDLPAGGSAARSIGASLEHRKTGKDAVKWRIAYSCRLRPIWTLKRAQRGIADKASRCRLPSRKVARRYQIWRADPSLKDAGSLQRCSCCVQRAKYSTKSRRSLVSAEASSGSCPTAVFTEMVSPKPQSSKYRGVRPRC